MVNIGTKRDWTFSKCQIYCLLMRKLVNVHLNIFDNYLHSDILSNFSMQFWEQKYEICLPCVVVMRPLWTLILWVNTSCKNHQSAIWLRSFHRLKKSKATCLDHDTWLREHTLIQLWLMLTNKVKCDISQVKIQLDN